MLCPHKIFKKVKKQYLLCQNQNIIWNPTKIHKKKKNPPNLLVISGMYDETDTDSVDRFQQLKAAGNYRWNLFLLFFFTGLSRYKIKIFVLVPPSLNRFIFTFS